MGPLYQWKFQSVFNYQWDGLLIITRYFHLDFPPIQLKHRSSYIWIERSSHLQIRGQSHTFCLYYPCHSTVFPITRLLFHSITITFKGQMWAKCPLFGVCSFQVSAHSRGHTPILHTLDAVAWECNLRSRGGGKESESSNVFTAMEWRSIFRLMTIRDC